jgi:hypothetical protein
LVSAKTGTPRARNRRNSATESDGGRGQFDPAVVPHADLGAPVGVGVGPAIDRVAEVVAAIHQVVHRVQIDLGEHRAPPLGADLAVIEPLGLPFDQHVADVEDHRLHRHGLSLAWKVTWSSMKLETKK